jgi:hypothetical protein
MKSNAKRNVKPRKDTKLQVMDGDLPLTIARAAEILGCRYDTLKQRLAKLRKLREINVIDLKELRR